MINMDPDVAEAFKTSHTISGKSFMLLIHYICHVLHSGFSNFHFWSNNYHFKCSLQGYFFPSDEDHV